MSAADGLTYHAWVYPGAPATNAPDTFRRGVVDVLRVEYFTLQNDGSFKLLTENPTNLGATANAFSDQNVRDIKANSREQLVTVSGSELVALRKLWAAPKLPCNTLVQFVVRNRLTGIDIDFERFGQWTSTDYNEFKTFCKYLGNRLHLYNKKLAVCMPVWSNAVGVDPPFPWNYFDWVSLPVDYITPMGYDQMYDYGAGGPVTALDWLEEWSKYLVKVFGNGPRLVIGIPSYGYRGTLGKYDIKILTKAQVIAAEKYNTAKRDVVSGEVINISGTSVYVANDTVSMRKKLDVLKKCGVSAVSVWHLGGNDWF